ncbi:MAG TPA: SDR family NAD(P)-dependent oxidoreductase [Novosphingobium sp.]
MSANLFDLTGRVALVTGAARGLGRAIAIGLAGAGAHVVVAARDRVAGAAVAEDIAAAGGEASVQLFDLTDHAATAAAIPALVERLGRLDVLVNTAGVPGWAPLEDSTADELAGIMAVNLTPTYLLCREAARVMRTQGWGRIINFSSYVATTGRERLATYSASKAAVEGLTRAVAAEYAGTGVTCNAVAPGIFDTDMARPTAGNPARAAVFSQAIAMHRFGDPAEIVGPVLFLATAASAYVTGQVLAVGGGLGTILSLPVAVAPD